jgi:2-oxoglutarate ferredoxin oxidoreductase subunit gamma
MIQLPVAIGINNSTIGCMTEEIIIAGFGGQGVLSMGKILAYSGVMQNKEVSWMPSYGPEMRGGTANVTVIISDERISSPIVNSYDTAIILNQQSLDKFERTVKPGGLLLYDPNGITRLPVRKDINIYSIAAADEAGKIGLSKVFNMIVLGGFLKLKPLVNPENIHKGLEKSLPARHHGMIPDNEKAIQFGKDLLIPVVVLN